MKLARNLRWMFLLVAAVVFVEMRTIASPDCPLDLSHSNFTVASSLCSNQETRAKCCRYINAVIAISITRLANVTGNLGVPPDLSDKCFGAISKALDRYGVASSASIFCGFGSKIPLNYECRGRSTVTQMLESPNFRDVGENCKLPLSEESSCKKCLNSGILYLRDLLGLPLDNVTLSTCRDATFAAIASRVGYASTLEIAGCFFGVQDLITTKPEYIDLPPSLIPPSASASSPTASNAPSLSLTTPVKERRRRSRLNLFLGIGIAVTSFSTIMFFVLVLLICKKKRELDDSTDDDVDDNKASTNSTTARKLQDGPSPAFRKFSYREIKKATGDFGTVVGQGGFGVVYKAVFGDGLVAAVKRMSKVSEQADGDFCRELELLARLHHRHLVSLRGYCIQRRERFLIYEYMENGSLKSHLIHTPGSTPLSWRSRVQIAIDVANALEYLHYYCNPPLCHRDIKSSNILLDENYTAKVADFGLAHASKDGSISFEPVNTDIRGTPGYLDPEYMTTQQLTEKSDVYSYGVVLLELITGRRAVQDNRNLVEWSQPYLTSSGPTVTELVDPCLGEAFDFDQLMTIVGLVRWCTHREGRSRPSIKQVLRLLYESSVSLHGGFVEAVEDEDKENGSKGRRSRGKSTRVFSGGLASSSSTTRSYCSRSFLLETGSPNSPNNNNPSL